MRKREDGYCFVGTKQGHYWHLRRDQYETTRRAWLRGAAIVDTVGFYGDRITIKLTEVDSVSDMSPEVIQACIEADRADSSDDSMAGST